MIYFRETSNKTWWPTSMCFLYSELNFCISVGCIPSAHYHMGGNPFLERDHLSRDPRTETLGQRPLGQRPLLDRDPRTENPPWQRHPWTETPWTETPDLDTHPTWTDTPPRQRPPLPPGQRTPPGQRDPSCEQNHRQVWKHNLSATSLRDLSNFAKTSYFLKNPMH